MIMKYLLIIGGLLLSLSANSINYDLANPQLHFAAGEIERALLLRKEYIAVNLVIDNTFDIGKEGFEIIKTPGVITVKGNDSAGAMYGGLDLAETILSEGCLHITNKREAPYMQMRGVKFNIPLDVRTPSYSDVSDSGQKNIETVWDIGFWKEYIDALAIHRYNYISLWSLNPFPSLVKVPEYPDVSLDDVKRSKGPFKEYYSLRGTDFDGPEFYETNLLTVKKITIDQKIAFWKDVMSYAKSRNVDFYIVTWNIFTYGINGKYGIDDSPENKITQDYFRKSVETLFKTYPLLAGIGITTGENMENAHVEEGGAKKMSAEQKEDWIVATYVSGTLDALNNEPNRKIKFIHRQHETSTSMILQKMKPLLEHSNVDLIFSYKYAQAHVYSTTTQPVYGYVKTITGKVKTIWTLRNDDVYLYRWGAPDFVREFVKNIPYEISQGYYYGHDGWINGREFTDKNPLSPRQLEIEKHWMQFMLWGRFGYNPNYSNDRIANQLHARFPEINGPLLLDAWQKASMVYPKVTSFHWGPLDFNWYIEGCRSHTRSSKTDSGFHDVNSFINTKVHPMGGVQSIKNLVEGVPLSNLISPFQLANEIEQYVESSTKLLKQIGSVTNRDLQKTLQDIEILNEMGRYYADKIRGATYVALARKSGFLRSMVKCNKLALA